MLLVKYSSFFLQCFNKETSGVGVFIPERWIDSVVYMARVIERIMYVKLDERRMTSGTALSMCPLKFLNKRAF